MIIENKIKAVSEGLWDKIMKMLVQKTRGNKCKKGRKRHIVTETMGNLLAVHVHATHIHDTKGGVFTFEKELFITRL